MRNTDAAHTSLPLVIISVSHESEAFDCCPPGLGSNID